MNETPPDSYCQKTTLPNGLRILTSAMPHTRSVALSIYVGAGSRYETPPESGISHFIEHVCFKGTRKRPTAQLISEAVDGVGGILNAATDREFTVFYAKVALPHLELALDVLVDLVQAPVFDPVEIEKERKVILEEIASIVDSPAQQADLLLDQLVWPDQPLGWDIAGTRESVEGLTREDTLGYMGRQYVPSNTVVAVAGNVDHGEMTALIGSTLGQSSKGSPGPWFPAIEAQESPRCSILNKRTEQAHITLALRGLPMDHPDRFAMDLLSILLGEGMSSRLFLELRERLGLCYDVHSYVSHFRDTGAFGVYAAVDPANGKQALSALLKELSRLGDGIPEEELNKARELAKGRMLLRMEDTRAVAGWMGGQELLTGKVNSPDEVVAKIDAVTCADLARVAGNLLQRHHLNLAVVGPYRSERPFLSLLSL